MSTRRQFLGSISIWLFASSTLLAFIGIITMLIPRIRNNKEKIKIAKKYMWPEIISELNMKPQKITISIQALKKLLNDHTKNEPGVRELKHHLKNISLKIMRKVYDNYPSDKLSDKKSIREFLMNCTFKVNVDNVGELVEHV